MSTLFNNTRTGELFAAITSGISPEMPDNAVQEKYLRAQVFVFAAMGAEYLLCCFKSNHRDGPTAYAHWLQFCHISNPELFSTQSARDELKKLLDLVLRDVTDINNGKIK